MRIDWQALASNPWFQLCALVAILSGGASIYDFTHGGQHPAPTPTPTVVVNTPPPLQPKTPHTWIVDASGAADADSRDLNAVAASLADGDTVTVRPGSYTANFSIARNARFIGVGAKPESTVIHSGSGNTVRVSNGTVSFQNLSIGMDSAGSKFAALFLYGNARVELDHCLIVSKGLFGAGFTGSSSISARDSTFTTSGGGVAANFMENARGQFTLCTVTFNRWGVKLYNAAQVKVTKSTFEKNGLITGGGSVLSVQGSQARVDLDHCQFDGNTGSLLATEGGSLSITDSVFKDNGVTGEQGNANSGLISVTNNARATLLRVVFESNKQGVSVQKGGAATISACPFSHTGIRTDNADLQFYLPAISVSDRGSSATVNEGSSIDNSANFGINIVYGAHLDLDDVSVTDSMQFGLILGATGSEGATANIRRGKFIHNQTGITIVKGSSASIQDCQIIGNTTAGIWLNGANAKASISGTEFRENKVAALRVDGLATGHATGCTFDGNDRGAVVGQTNHPEAKGDLTLEDCSITNSRIIDVVTGSKSTATLRGVTSGKNKLTTAEEESSDIRVERSKPPSTDTHRRPAPVQ